jgi:hypothetical protein
MTSPWLTWRGGTRQCWGTWLTSQWHISQVRPEQSLVSSIHFLTLSKSFFFILEDQLGEHSRMLDSGQQLLGLLRPLDLRRLWHALSPSHGRACNQCPHAQFSSLYSLMVIAVAKDLMDLPESRTHNILQFLHQVGHFEELRLLWAFLGKSNCSTVLPAAINSSNVSSCFKHCSINLVKFDDLFLRTSQSDVCTLPQTACASPAASVLQAGV